MIKKILRKLFSPLLRIRDIIKDFILVRKGFIALRSSKTTPDEAKTSMLNLFCNTSGISNEILHKFIKMAHPKTPLESFDGVLNFKSQKEIAEVAENIRRDGFHVFPEIIDAHTIADLYRFATTQKAKVRPLVDQGPGYKLPEHVINLEKPLGIRYDFTEDQVISIPAAQNLFTDPSIVALAQEYLDCAPVLKQVIMWWHTDYSKEANDESATMWHFDLDYIRWLNFFFYLTDVTPESGPHAFVRGTHRPLRIPRKLLRRGYARITDDEIKTNYDTEDILQFVGKKGTLIVEDTRGLHKGTAVQKGARLLMQFSFADHMFSSRYPEQTFRKFENPRAANFVTQYPYIYQKYT